MTPLEIPQELIDIIDERAGKKHSREGKVLTALAEILTKYDEIRICNGDNCCAICYCMDCYHDC